MTTYVERFVEPVGFEMKIPLSLASPNKDRGAHWSRKHQATQAWEHAIATLGGTTVRDFQLIESEVPVRTRTGWKLKARRRRERRRVIITRVVGNARRLIRDDDNRRYTSKPILDALKRLGLLYDDRREWCDHPEPQQHVAKDCEDHTVIRIEILGDQEEKSHAG